MKHKVQKASWFHTYFLKLWSARQIIFWPNFRLEKCKTSKKHCVYAILCGFHNKKILLCFFIKEKQKTNIGSKNQKETVPKKVLKVQNINYKIWEMNLSRVINSKVWWKWCHIYAKKQKIKNFLKKKYFFFLPYKSLKNCSFSCL